MTVPSVVEINAADVKQTRAWRSENWGLVRQNNLTVLFVEMQENQKGNYGHNGNNNKKLHVRN